MKEKTSFVLYHDIRYPLELLTDEQCGKMFRAILDYSEYGVIPDFQDGAMAMAFAFIRNAIDRDAEKWEKKSIVRSEAGRAGGKKTQEKKRTFKQNEANEAFASNAQISEANQAVPVPAPVPASVPVPAPVNNNISVLAEPKRKKPSVPPTREEVRAYCEERKNNVDPDQFYDYYDSNNWHDQDGKPVRSWKQKMIAVWERGEKHDRNNHSGGHHDPKASELYEIKTL